MNLNSPIIKIFICIVTLIFMSNCNSNIIEDVNEKYSFSEIKIYISSPDIEPKAWADISFDNLEKTADIKVEIMNDIDKFIQSINLNNLVKCSNNIKMGYPHLKILLINKINTYIIISDGETLATGDLKYCMSVNDTFMNKFNLYKQ